MRFLLPPYGRPQATQALDAAIAANIAAHQGAVRAATGVRAEAVDRRENARAVLTEIRTRVDHQKPLDPTIRTITEGLQAMGKRS